MNGNDRGQRADVLPLPTPVTRTGRLSDDFHEWRSVLRSDVLTAVADFVSHRCAVDMAPAGVDIAADLVQELVGGGKCVRSTFTYLGWRCGADDDAAAVRAAASFEVLHAFALLQDDVMDGSTMRRGRPSAHIAFAR